MEGSPLMDISDTLAPNSDQLDAIDLIGNPRTFTITKVSKGSTEQPVDIHLAEFPRVWRPGKSMRRVLAACWGTDASVYVGRRVTLYCDESVRFGNDVVGGTRISHLSHIDKPKSIPLLISRGKSATFKVQPLAEPNEPTPAELAEQTAAALTDATTEAEVREWGNRAHARSLLDLSPKGATGTLREMVQARLAELASETPADEPLIGDPA
jgi:hypothetical protein